MFGRFAGASNLRDRISLSSVSIPYSAKILFFGLQLRQASPSKL